MFLEGIERDQWNEMDWTYRNAKKEATMKRKYLSTKLHDRLGNDVLILKIYTNKFVKLKVDISPALQTQKHSIHIHEMKAIL